MAVVAVTGVTLRMAGVGMALGMRLGMVVMPRAGRAAVFSVAVSTAVVVGVTFLATVSPIRQPGTTQNKSQLPPWAVHRQRNQPSC